MSRKNERNSEEQSPSEPTTALVPARVHSQDLTPLPGTPLSGCPTSLDLTTEEGKARAINGLGEPDVAFAGASEIEFEMTDFLIHPVSKVDEETGELSEFTRLVLWDSKGQTFATTSMVVPHRLAAIFSLYPAERLRQGLRLLLVERKARKTGRTYHDLKVLPE